MFELGKRDRPGAVNDVDSLRNSIDDDRGLAHELYRDADFLEDLASRGIGGLLAPLEQPPGDTPVVAIDLTDEQHSAVGTLDDADRTNRVGRCDQTNEPSAHATRDASVQPQQRCMDVPTHVTRVEVTHSLRPSIR